MREADFAPLCAMLDDVWGLKGQPLTGGQKAIFFKALAAHPLDAVRAGLDAHVKDPERGRFLPMPADIIAQILAKVANDGRPGADEAWAIALRAADESDTVVWTAEMAQAWEACRPVMSLGDEVGARMAFRDAYNRLVASARADGIAPAWAASLGFDAERRALAIGAAVQRGLLPAADVAGLLPAPEERSGPPSPRMRALLLELRERIVADNAAAESAPTLADAEREALAGLKREAAAKVNDYAEQIEGAA